MGTAAGELSSTYREHSQRRVPTACWARSSSFRSISAEADGGGTPATNDYSITAPFQAEFGRLVGRRCPSTQLGQPLPGITGKPRKESHNALPALIMLRGDGGKGTVTAQACWDVVTLCERPDPGALATTARQDPQRAPLTGLTIRVRDDLGWRGSSGPNAFGEWGPCSTQRIMLLVSTCRGNLQPSQCRV